MCGGHGVFRPLKLLHVCKVNTVKYTLHYISVLSRIPLRPTQWHTPCDKHLFLSGNDSVLQPCSLFDIRKITRHTFAKPIQVLNLENPNYLKLSKCHLCLASPYLSKCRAQQLPWAFQWEESRTVGDKLKQRSRGLLQTELSSLLQEHRGEPEVT